MASKVSYKQGSKATYLGLLARNPDALYFCTDTHELFRGDDLYSDGLRIVGSYQALPTYAFAADGIIYFCKDTGCGYVLNEARDGWINVIHGVDNKTIVADENGLLRVDVIPISSVAGLEEKLANINNGTVSSGVITSVSDELTVSDSGMLSIRAVEQVKVIGLEDKLASIEKSISGGNVDYVGVEPAEDDMPKVFIAGVKPTTKDDVLAEMQYISKTDNFHAYLEIKCQGTSSLSWPKKNFTVKLFSDEARETKLRKNFKDWNHNGNKYVLKANYIDHSHARNIVSARLWNEVVKSRPDYDSLPVEMKNSPRNGAVDGFPIKVYYNGNYEGVYTWNIGKDDWMWGMDEDNPNHVLLCAEGNTDGVYAETTSNFRKLWNGVDGQKPGWSVEVGTNSTALKNSLNNLIQFVMDNDGDAFRNGIGNYLDIQSAIDYYIFQYEICGLDGLAHNMLLATYDGKLWRCGAYDLDATFGLWWNGTTFVPATFACPEDYQERYSLLWERIESNFLPELKARQAELRKTVLSYSNMVTHFERFMDIIGLDLYAEDLTIYTGIPSGSTNNIKQIRNYIRDRQAYVDAEFAAMPGPIPCEGIMLNKNTLTFNGEGTQIVTATAVPDGCTDSVVWVSSNPAVAVISVDGNVCTVEAIANGSATITATCGNQTASCIVYVDGIVTALYPLENGEHAFSTAVLTVTNGSHVKIDQVTGATYYAMMNIGNIGENGVGASDTNNVRNKSSKYSLKEGDVIRTVIRTGDANTYTDKMSVYFAHPTGTTETNIVGDMELANVVRTTTLTNDLDISTIGIYIDKLNANEVVDFGIWVYVNDIMYVGSEAIDEYEDYTRLVFDGTQSIAIPQYGINPSGTYGGTHFEYVMPGISRAPDIIAPPDFTYVARLNEAANRGAFPVWSVTEWNRTVYLIVSLDTNLVGTTVDTINAWLAENNLVFYYS